jgi:hypothetical protein
VPLFTPPSQDEPFQGVASSVAAVAILTAGSEPDAPHTPILALIVGLMLSWSCPHTTVQILLWQWHGARVLYRWGARHAEAVRPLRPSHLLDRARAVPRRADRPAHPRRVPVVRRPAVDRTRDRERVLPTSTLD